MNPLLLLLAGAAVVLATPHHVARHDAIAARIARRDDPKGCKPSSSSPNYREPAVNVGIKPSTQDPSPYPTRTRNDLTTTTMSTSTTPRVDNTPTPVNTTPVNTPTPVPTTPNTGLPSFSDGSATYYYAGLGACGFVSSGTDFIVALPHGLFDQHTPDGNSNHNTLCNKMITATHGTRSITVKVADRCEACEGGHIDLSTSAFDSLKAPGDDGVIPNVVWSFN